MRTVDLNCDLGEGAGHDAELMPLITSANIICGAHAGDPATMQATMALARQHGVAVGAHPGFADREYFGRREILLTTEPIGELVHAQVEQLRALGPIRHVKLHGALYNLAARDREVAAAVAAAVRAIDDGLILFALAGSQLVRAGRARGLRVAEEVFGGRTYRPDGSLTPRSLPGAVIENEDQAVAQVLRMVGEGTVCATDGSEVRIVADTVCLHGDGEHAVAFARRLNEALSKAGFALKAFGA